jgi:hypothetical protein
MQFASNEQEEVWTNPGQGLVADNLGVPRFEGRESYP